MRKKTGKNEVRPPRDMDEAPALFGWCQTCGGVAVRRVGRRLQCRKCARFVAKAGREPTGTTLAPLGGNAQESLHRIDLVERVREVRRSVNGLPEDLRMSLDAQKVLGWADYLESQYLLLPIPDLEQAWTMLQAEASRLVVLPGLVNKVAVMGAALVGMQAKMEVLDKACKDKQDELNRLSAASAKLQAGFAGFERRTGFSHDEAEKMLREDFALERQVEGLREICRGWIQDGNGWQRRRDEFREQSEREEVRLRTLLDAQEQPIEAVSQKLSSEDLYRLYMAASSREIRELLRVGTRLPSSPHASPALPRATDVRPPPPTPPAGSVTPSGATPQQGNERGVSPEHLPATPPPSPPPALPPTRPTTSAGGKPHENPSTLGAAKPTATEPERLQAELNAILAITSDVQETNPAMARRSIGGVARVGTRPPLRSRGGGLRAVRKGHRRARA